ncbi:uncharacterized protein LOC144645364 [Oculina patagonica]
MAEHVHPDLRGIIFSAPLLTSEDKEDNTEKVVKKEIENFSVTNTSKDSQVVIASLSSNDAPLINFSEVSLETQESLFQEFSGDPKNLNVSDNSEIPLGSEVQDKDDNATEELVDLSIEFGHDFFSRSNDTFEIKNFIHPDLEDIDFSVQPTIQRENDFEEDSLFASVAINDNIFMDMPCLRKYYQCEQDVEINPRLCDVDTDHQTIVVDIKTIMLIIFIKVSLYLSALKLLVDIGSSPTDTFFLPFDDCFRTKNPIDLSNTDLNFFKWFFASCTARRHTEEEFKAVTDFPSKLCSLCNCMIFHFSPVDNCCRVAAMWRLSARHSKKQKRSRIYVLTPSTAYVNFLEFVFAVLGVPLIFVVKTFNANEDIRSRSGGNVTGCFAGLIAKINS